MEINYLSILIVAAASMALGFLWYSPALFGRQWIHLMQFSEDPMAKMKEKGRLGMYVLPFVLQVLMALSASILLSAIGTINVGEALNLAFWVWLGFMVPILSGSFLWERKPKSLFAINAGYWLTTSLVIFIVLVLI